MIKFFRSGFVGSNKGISIILAIIIIVILGLAGSIFAYLMASGSIVSRSNLLSAEAKYASKSGIEITLYGIENNLAFSLTPPSACPASPVSPPGVGVKTTSLGYLSGDLAGNLPTSVNYTPAFCAVEGTLKKAGKAGKAGKCTYYYDIITSNGLAGGTEREVTAEVYVGTGTGCTPAVIYVEAEPPNQAG